MAIKKNLEAQYERWCDSNYTTLREVYGRWSGEKERAYKACLEKCSDMNGWNFRIVSHNSWMFTVGWLYRNEEGKNMFWYETPSNSYTWAIPERSY